MLTHIVRYLLPDVFEVESSWCAPFRSTPLVGARRLGLKWLGWGGGGHMTPLHMISHMAGLSRDLLYIGIFVEITPKNGLQPDTSTTPLPMRYAAVQYSWLLQITAPYCTVGCSDFHFFS
jgi:hypothetical protein